MPYFCAKKKMKHVVFEPWIKDDLFKKGLKNRNRVLVLGHSHYCDRHPECPFRDKCRSTVSGCRDCRTDCHYMDEIQEEFPNEWKEKGLALNTQTEIEQFLKGNGQNTYKKFSNFMCKYFGYSTEEFWNRIAYYNYVQYFLPSRGSKKYWITKDQENDLAFEEMLTMLPALPDVIIAWGTVGNHLYDRYRVDGKSGEYKYLFKIKLQGEIVDVLNSYHPAYSLFKDGGKLKNSMDSIFL